MIHSSKGAKSRVRPDRIISTRSDRAHVHGVVARARACTQALFCRRRHQPRRPTARQDQAGKAKFSHPRLKKIASFHCGLTMSKGNCRANGISERESNNQPDCKDDQDISHTSTEFLVSVEPGRVPTGCCSSILSSWPERMERASSKHPKDSSPHAPQASVLHYPQARGVPFPGESVPLGIQVIGTYRPSDGAAEPSGDIRLQ